MLVKRHIAFALVVAGCASQSHNGASVICSPPECPADTSLQLVAEVAPPSSSVFVQQEFPFIALDSQSSQFTLQLDPVVTLAGTVKVDNPRLGPQNVAATVVATRPSRIAGRPPMYYQSTVDPATGQYKLVVPQNVGDEKYTIRVTTTDPTVAPPRQLDLSLTADQLDYQLWFADPLSLPELRGVLTDSLKNPLAGVQVQAIVPRASDSDPVVVLSTTSTTDANGNYSLRLGPNPPAAVTLVATAKELPTLMLNVPTSKLGPATPSMTTNLALPALPSVVNVTYQVVGTSSSGATTPVVGASCVFVADVTDPHATDGVRASFRATAVTDALGQASVGLIPSDTGNRTYQVVVAPDASSMFGSLTATADVAPSSGYGKQFVLALRPTLSGRVLDPMGAPVRNVTVTLGASTVATGGTTLSPFNGTATPPQTVSDLDGRFAVRADKGTWDVGLIPPPDSMLPRRWLSNNDVESDVDLSTVTLPTGVKVTAIVRGSTGVALARANVRLYTVAPQCNGASDPTACASPPRLRAEGSSSAGGLVDLILPSTPKP